MLKKQDMSKRDHIGFYSLEDLVPKEHLLRDIILCGITSKRNWDR